MALEFDAHGGWLEAFRLGARAVVFLEPAEPGRMDRSECEAKATDQPLVTPRFYLAGKVAATVRAAVENLKGMDPALYPQVKLFCESKWNFEDGRSIWAYVPGTPTPGADEPLDIVWANLDGSGVVLDHAPSARTALGSAVLLELAKYYGPGLGGAPDAPRPKGGLLLIFNTDHALGMNGERQFVELNARARELVASLGANSHPLPLLAAMDAADLSGRLARLVDKDDLSVDVDASSHLVGYVGGKPVGLWANLPAGVENPDDLDFEEYSEIRDAVAKWYQVKRMEALCRRFFEYEQLVAQVPPGAPLPAGAQAILDQLCADPIFRSVTKDPAGQAAEVKDRMTAGSGEHDPLIRDMPPCAPEFLKKVLGTTESDLQRRQAALNSRFDIDPGVDPGRDILKTCVDQELDDIHTLRAVINRSHALDAELADLEKALQSGTAEQQELAKGVLARAMNLQKPRLMQQAMAQLGEREAYLRDVIERFSTNWPLYKILCGALPPTPLPGSQPAPATGRRGQPAGFFLSLELTTGSGRVGLLPAGAMLGQPGLPADVMKNAANDIMRVMARAEYQLAQPGADMKNAPDDPQGMFAVQTMNNSKREWPTCVSGNTPLSSEIALTTALPAFGMVSVFDGAPYSDSPADRLFPARDYPEDWRNIDRQVSYLSALLPRLFDHEGTFNEQASFQRWFKYTYVHGRVLMRGAGEVFPQTPVSHALVVLSNGGQPEMRGVNPDYFTYSNPFGEFRLKAIRIGGAEFITGYKIDPVTGQVVMAPDLADANSHVLTWTPTKQPVVEQDIELAPLRGVGILSNLDPRFLVSLGNLQVLDGQTDSVPTAFSYTPMKPNDQARVVFGMPSKSVKVLYSQGKFGVRMAFLGGPPPLDTDLEAEMKAATTVRKARGDGYPARTTGTLTYPDWQATFGMLRLDSQRMEQLREKSIENAAIDKLHSTTIDSMHLAQKDLAKGDYTNYIANVRSALGTEARAYPDVRNTGNDTVVGVVFYLFLLLPFCFFVERLFVASRKIEKQLGWFFAIFVMMFLLLSVAHPAFSLVTAPSMILLSFVMLALSFLVIAIVYGKFNTEMKKLQAGVQEIKQDDGTTKTVQRQSQSAEINRSSALMLALTLGISNMKRRPIRTGLTCATVIILTFTTLSFTSVVNSVSNTGIEMPYPSTYDGIYLHDPRWKQMPEANVDLLRARYALVDDGPQANARPNKVVNLKTGATAPDLSWAVNGEQRALVLPRSWWIPIDPNTPFEIELIRPASSSAAVAPISVHVDAAVGLTPDEGEVQTNGHSILEGMQVHPNTLLTPETQSQWKLFTGDYASQIVISQSTAAALGWSNPQDAIGQTLLVMGRPMTVCNVMLDGGPYAFDNVKELDNDPITPVMLSKKNAGEYTSTSDADFELTDTAAAVHANNQFMSQDKVILLPYGTCLSLGGTLRSISIRQIKRTHYLVDRAKARGEDAKSVAAKSAVRLEAEDLLMVLEKNIYVGDKQVATLFSSSAKSSVTGLINIVIPLLISALIILNTMVGAVYERRREIAIFSALGLAPLHIGMLFLAESLVYATLGGMSGYLLGQGVSKLVVISGVNLGFSLNYSSTITVFVTAIVMGCVLLSTLYPAYVAQKIAVPSEEKREGMTELNANSLWLELPFSFPGHIVPGVAMFLHDYFQSHTEGSVGRFTAREVTLETIRTPHGPGLCLFFLCWPIPYDLGVSQEIQFYLVPDENGVFTSEMVLHHISGERSAWKRVNRPFVDEIRRLMLLWRTFTPEQRSEFALRGLAQWFDSYEGIGWEMPEQLKAQRNRELGELTGEGEDDEESVATAPAGA
ncbi:MAG: ABC transporter permease [Planctomycetota bacterium]